MLTLATPRCKQFFLSSNKGIVIDTISVIGSVTSPTADGTYKIGDSINITINFLETVDVVTTAGNPTLELETGITDRTAYYTSGSGSSNLTFTYTVEEGDISLILITHQILHFL